MLMRFVSRSLGVGRVWGKGGLCFSGLGGWIVEICTGGTVLYANIHISMSKKYRVLNSIWPKGGVRAFRKNA